MKKEFEGGKNGKEVEVNNVRFVVNFEITSVLGMKKGGLSGPCYLEEYLKKLFSFFSLRFATCREHRLK